MTDIESRHLRDDKMNRCPGRVGPFFWGVLAMAGLAVVLFFVDDIYFEGEYLTQKKKVHELQNRLAKANYDMAEQQSFIEKVTSILGISSVEEAKRLIMDKNFDEQKLKALQAQSSQERSELSETRSKMQAEAERIRKLAEEVEKLKSKFRNAFREILSEFPDVTIEGDRFAFKDDILFLNASVKLSKKGEKMLDSIAKQILKVNQIAPQEMPWFIRIDGHTNHLPIYTSVFPSNWYLSTGRAVSVINYLLEKGVPAKRLVAAGFSSNWPLVNPQSADAITQNRRIEISFSHY